MTPSKKDQIRALLKSIETGDPAGVAVVNEAKYIQHNPHSHEGSEGLAQLFLRLSKTNPRVEIVRAFEDGDFVFAHTEYDFADENVGFEVFRFENGQAVEHWDNLQSRMGPNSSGNEMTDGPTEPTDLDRTELNRQTVREFTDVVLRGRRLDKLAEYLNVNDFVDHDPYTAEEAALRRYDTVHRILAEGSFVLCMCEGGLAQVPYSFYELYRLENAKIVEHWNTIDPIPPRDEWKNSNGKF